MTDFRQCDRCGRTDAIPGTMLDASHLCPHGRPCVVGILHGCGDCIHEEKERVMVMMRERKAFLAAQIKATLPAGRNVLMAKQGGIPSGVAAGPAGVVRGSGQ